MPFSHNNYRPFTRAGIEVLAAGQIGVYGIFRDGGPWIYVGRGDIRTRLLAHLNGDNPLITRENPTHFVADVTANDEAREKALIVELQPVANRKVG